MAFPRKNALDVLLIHLPMPQGMFRVPLGLFSIADWLKRRGVNARVYDMRMWSDFYNWVWLSGRIPSTRWVGVQLMTVQILWFLEFCELLAPVLAGKLVVGGTHPTLYPGQVEPYAEAVCAEGGEDFMARLLGCNGRKFDLATLGPRDWSLIDVRAYADLGMSIHDCLSGPGLIGVETSRGCNGRCAFCINQRLPWMRCWQPRPVEHVLAECEYLGRAHGVRRWLWDEDYFLGDVERALRLAEGLTAMGYNGGWGGAARVGDVTRAGAAIAELAALGMRSLNIGIESGDNAMLRRLHKPHTVDQARECADILQAAGVRGIYSYMTNLPGETDDQKRMTRELLRDIQRRHPLSRTTPPGGGMQPYRPLPGTELAAQDARRWPESLPEWADALQNDPEMKAMMV